MIKVLNITIQHSPIKGDPNEWVMDIIGIDENDKARKKTWAAITCKDMVGAIPAIFGRLNDEFDWNDRACGNTQNQ